MSTHDDRATPAHTRWQANPTAGEQQAQDDHPELQNDDKQVGEEEAHKHCTTARAERPGDQSPDQDWQAQQLQH